MLRVDLGRLRKKGRIRIERGLPPDADAWDTTGLNLAAGLAVGLDVQLAGPDVLVRGRISGSTVDSCRRCLRPLEGTVDEDVTFLYRAGLGEADATAQDVYAFDASAQELDLGPAVREQLILAATRYPLCSASCRGLCASCGTDLNSGTCECRAEEIDPRWRALRETTK